MEKEINGLPILTEMGDVPFVVDTNVVLASEWQWAFDFVALRNRDNLGNMQKQYDEWRQERDIALAQHRQPRPKIPYLKKLAVVALLNGHPKIVDSPYDVFEEPPPPEPFDVKKQTTYTDSLGVVWYRHLTGKVLPWGAEATWSTDPTNAN